MITFNSFPEVLNGLLERKIQVAIIDESFLIHMETDNPVEIIGVANTQEYVIAIRKEDVELKNILNDGLKN